MFRLRDASCQFRLVSYEPNTLEGLYMLLVGGIQHHSTRNPIAREIWLGSDHSLRRMKEVQENTPQIDCHDIAKRSFSPTEIVTYPGITALRFTKASRPNDQAQHPHPAHQ